jgi:hypothetical protein
VAVAPAACLPAALMLPGCPVGCRSAARVGRQLGMRAHQRALHCLADLRTSSDEMRAHWFSPYFITAAFRISSCRDSEQCA